MDVGRAASGPENSEGGSEARKLQDLLAPLPVCLPVLRHRGWRQRQTIAPLLHDDRELVKKMSYAYFKGRGGRFPQRRRIISQRPRLSRLAREPAT